jgi:hypothetical protein
MNYVNRYGYNNTDVDASYYSNLTNAHLASTYYNAWLVRYKASAADYSVYAVIDSSGSVAGNYTATP